MKGLWKEKVGDKIMITTVTKKYFGLYSFERWFYYDSEGIWTEIPDKIIIEDRELINELNIIMEELPLTYTIR